MSSADVTLDCRSTTDHSPVEKKSIRPGDVPIALTEKTLRGALEVGIQR